MNEVELGSGNIFEDLGVSQPEEKLLKTKLIVAIVSILESKNLTQVESAEVLGLTQNKVSDLKNGKIKGFSVEKLFALLNKLNRDIDIRIRLAPKKQGQGTIHLVAA